MTTIENTITSLPGENSKPACDYVDLGRGAQNFGLRAQVELERRVLEDYVELDPGLGENVAGVVLSVLSYDVLTDGRLGDSRMTICLLRRDSGQPVEVDLGVYRRCHGGQETYVLRFMGERELSLGAD